MPPGAAAPAYRNIRVVQTGRHTGMLWEQLDYTGLPAPKTAGWGCAPAMSSRCLASAASRWFTMSVTAPGRDFYTAPRARLSAAWHRLQYRAIARTCKQIVTVSQFSRSELQKYYGVSPDRVTVVPNAWQHMQRVAADEGVFAKWPQLRRGEYYFSMSNLLKNKNFPWVLQAARSKPDAVFCHCRRRRPGRGGGQAGDAAPAQRALPGLCLGRRGQGADGKLQGRLCSPPSTRVSASRRWKPSPAVRRGCWSATPPCMREVYGPHADYIDLAANHGDVDAVTPGHDAAAVLARYSWAESARRLLELLRSSDR